MKRMHRFLKRHWRGLLASSVLIGGIVVSPNTATESRADNIYASIGPQSILSSAYFDGQQALAMADVDLGGSSKEKEPEKPAGDSEDGEPATPPAPSPAGDEDDGPSEAEYRNTIAWILQQGNFGNVGLLIAPRSNSTTSAATTAQSTLGLDQAKIEYLDRAGGHQQASAYYQFGLGMNDLLDQAAASDPTYLSMSAVTDGITATITSAGRLGLSILHQYNPAPVVMSFYDSSYLSGRSIGGESSGDNKLLKLINTNPVMISFIRFFGDPVVNGLSRAQMITFTVAIVSFGVYAFMKLFNNSSFPAGVRKLLLRIIVASMAIPASALLLTKSIGYMTGSYNDSTTAASDYIIEHNLNIANWYNNRMFAVPPGHSLEVQNGKFVLNKDLVRAINEYSDVNTTSFGSNRNQNIPKPRGWEDKELIGPAAKIVAQSQNKKNSFSVTFREGFNEAGAWSQGALVMAAEALGEATKFEPGEALQDVKEWNYLTTGKMSHQMTGNGAVFTQGDGGYGMSPIAAYSLLNTTFNTTGVAVKSNTTPAVVPAVAINVTGMMGAPKGASDGNPKAPQFVRLFALVVLTIASLQAIVKIVVAGFGGLLSGAGSSAFGAADGFGRMIGSVLALVVGIIGISAITGASITLMDMLWGAINDAFIGQSVETESVIEPIRTSLQNIPIIGGILASGMTGVAESIILLTSLFFIPTALKIPITALAAWASNIPESIAEKFRYWGSQFVGNQIGAPGGRGGHLANAAHQSTGDFKQGLQRAGTVASGLGTLALATAGTIGDFLSGDKQPGDVTETLNTNDNRGEGDNTLVENKAAESMAGNAAANQATGAENQSYSEGDQFADGNHVDDDYMESLMANEDSHSDQSVNADESNVHSNDSFDETGGSQSAYTDGSSMSDDNNLSLNEANGDQVTNQDDSAYSNVSNPMNESSYMDNQQIDDNASMNQEVNEDRGLSENTAVDQSGIHQDMSAVNEGGRSIGGNRAQNLHTESNASNQSSLNQSVGGHVAGNQVTNTQQRTEQSSQQGGSYVVGNQQFNDGAQFENNRLNAFNADQSRFQEGNQSVSEALSNQNQSSMDNRQHANLSTQSTGVANEHVSLSQQGIDQSRVEQTLGGQEGIVQPLGGSSMMNDQNSTLSGQSTSTAGGGMTAASGFTPRSAFGKGMQAAQSSGGALGGRSGSTIGHAASTLSNTKVGQQMASGIRKSQPYAQKAMSGFKQGAGAVGKGIQSIATNTKSAGQTIQSHVGQLSRQTLRDPSVNRFGTVLQGISGGRRLSTDTKRGLSKIATGITGHQIGRSQNPSVRGQINQRHNPQLNQQINSDMNETPQSVGGAAFTQQMPRVSQNEARIPQRRDGGPYTNKSKFGSQFNRSKKN